MAWTNLSSKVNGTLIDATEVNYWVGNFNYLLSPNSVITNFQNGVNYTIASTTWANVDAGNITATITSNGGLCTLWASFWAGNSNASYAAAFDIAVDGTRIGNSTWGLGVINGTAVGLVTLYYRAVLASGSRVVTLQWKTSNAGSTATIYTFPVTLGVVEG